MYLPSFTKTGRGIEAILRFCHRNMRGCNVDMMYAVEMDTCGTIYLPSFLKLGTGVRAILRFCLSNLNDCNVGITDGRYL
jgi:uncharacterized protein YraI